MLAFLGLPSPSSIAKDVINAFVSAFATDVGGLLSALFSFINKTTDPVFTSGWWTGSGHTLWLEVLLVSGSVSVIALMVAALEGVVGGNSAPMVKALAAMPMAALKTVGLVGVTSLLVNGTDQVANYFDSSILSQTSDVAAVVVAAITSTDLIGMVFAAILVLAILAVWAELVVRVAMLYIVVMVAPLVIASSIHPQLKQSWRKLLELGCGVIFSKVVIAIALNEAFSEMAGFGSSTSFAAGIGVLVTGIATLCVCCFSPFVLFRLFSFEVAAMEGLARRPSRAARDAMQMQYYAGKGLGGFLGRHGSAGEGAAAAAAGGAAGGTSSTGGSSGAGPGGGAPGGGASSGNGPGGSATAAASGGSEGPPAGTPAAVGALVDGPSSAPSRGGAPRGGGGPSGGGTSGSGAGRSSVGLASGGSGNLPGNGEGSTGSTPATSAAVSSTNGPSSSPSSNPGANQQGGERSASSDNGGSAAPPVEVGNANVGAEVGGLGAARIDARVGSQDQRSTPTPETSGGGVENASARRGVDESGTAGTRAESMAAGSPPTSRTVGNRGSGATDSMITENSSKQEHPVVRPGSAAAGGSTPKSSEATANGSPSEGRKPATGASGTRGSYGPATPRTRSPVRAATSARSARNGTNGEPVPDGVERGTNAGSAPDAQLGPRNAQRRESPGPDQGASTGGRSTHGSTAGNGGPKDGPDHAGGASGGVQNAKHPSPAGERSVSERSRSGSEESGSRSEAASGRSDPSPASPSGSGAGRPQTDAPRSARDAVRTGPARPPGGATVLDDPSASASPPVQRTLEWATDESEAGTAAVVRARGISEVHEDE